MILTIPQIENIILRNPNQSLILKGQDICRTMRMHMYGEGLNEHLKVIKGFEKQWMRDLRVMYTRTNKDLFARLGRPKDKIWSAKGGSVYYNLSEEQERRAVNLSTDVRNGYSIKEWLENVWALHCDDDPNGVLMMEVLDMRQATLAKQQGRSFVYPTYKSIMYIYDYQPKGIFLDYIAFELDSQDKIEMGFKPGDKVYRLVDDAYDYIVTVENNKVSIDTERSIINIFGMVPAVINSDIVNPLVEGSFLSMYDNVVSVADEFLRKGSIKVTSDFRNGFPKYAEYADDCARCKGHGVFDGEMCTECSGYGKAPMVYVSDTKLLPWPEDKERPIIKPSEVGGYIEPSKTYHEISVSDMIMLENIMTLTMWGVQAKIKAEGTNLNGTGDAKTATEIDNEIKPQADRLTPISKNIEKRHKFILDQLVKIQISYNYTGSSVHYGRRYMLEGPDTLWTKYLDAKEAGTSQSELDDILIDYIEAKYESNPLKIAVKVKLMKVEPFVHYTIEQVLTFKLTDQDYKEKLFYGEWLSLQSNAILYSATSIELKASLTTYAATKQLAEAPVITPVAA